MADIKTEEVSAIRNELKKRFGHTGLKFGVRKMHHSSVHVTIKAGPVDFSDLYKGHYGCLLYTSPSPRDLSTSRMPSSA